MMETNATDKLIIIKVNAYLRGEQLANLRKNLYSQLQGGLILVPNFCEVLVVPNNIEIKTEEDINE